MTRIIGLTTVLASVAAPAAADADLFSDDQLRGFMDFRAGFSDGERSWLDEGFGKTRFCGNDGDWAGRDHGTSRDFVEPTSHGSLKGHLHLQAEPHQDHALDVVEAYLTYRPMRANGWRFGARGGLMFPPVSLEHEGPAWCTTSTVTPSAINTWIGEEVSVIGLEGSAHHAAFGQEFEATIGLFGYNDTSGTLLSYRGWAMHDILTTAFGDFPLPARSPAWNALKASQAHTTEPTRELDDRLGYYARLEWKPTGPVTFDVLHYDNAGDRDSYEDGQWSWETRFTNIGMRLALCEDTHVFAQVMTGQTLYGRPTPMGYWVDMDFAAAYALVTHREGRQTYAGRVDLFETTDRTFTGLDNNDEEGWALTGAYRFALRPNVTLAFEGMHVRSDRPSRADVGLDPEQSQTTLQTALQLAY